MEVENQIYNILVNIHCLCLKLKALPDDKIQKSDIPMDK